MIMHIFCDCHGKVYLMCFLLHGGIAVFREDIAHGFNKVLLGNNRPTWLASRSVFSVASRCISDRILPQSFESSAMIYSGSFSLFSNELINFIL